MSKFSLCSCRKKLSPHHAKIGRVGDPVLLPQDAQTRRALRPPVLAAQAGLAARFPQKLSGRSFFGLAVERFPDALKIHKITHHV